MKNIRRLPMIIWRISKVTRNLFKINQSVWTVPETSQGLSMISENNPKTVEGHSSNSEGFPTLPEGLHTLWDTFQRCLKE